MAIFGKLGKRILFVLGLIALLLMVLDFNSRMAKLTRLTTQMEIENQSLAQLSSTRTVLETQISYATSDAAVEAWAREDGRLSQSGDYAIVPLPDANVTPQAPEYPFAEPPKLTNWQSWFTWLFFSRK
jgi:cell division protein FtsB